MSYQDETELILTSGQATFMKDIQEILNQKLLYSNNLLSMLNYFQLKPHSTPF